MAESRFDFKAALIQEVKEHPVLWKGEHEKYGERFCTAVAWKDIAQKLKISENILRAKWKNLRDTFRIVLKKSDISHIEEYSGKWKYFHLISFIKDEFKDDEGLVEFVVETDSGEENSDTESRISHTANSNNNHESEFLKQNNTTDDEETSKSNCDDRLNDENEIQSVNDEEIIRYVDRREYDDHTYHGKPEELEDNDIPSKRQKTSDRHGNYDVMFLKSLAPYFKQLDPLRKLVMRSKIQDLLLNEIAKQNSL